MSDIMVYLAMFSKIIDKILCFLGAPYFELFPTETWDFFDFLTNPPLFGLIPKFRCFFDWKVSLSKYFFPVS